MRTYSLGLAFLLEIFSELAGKSYVLFSQYVYWLCRPSYMFLMNISAFLSLTSLILTILASHPSFGAATPAQPSCKSVRWLTGGTTKSSTTTTGTNKGSETCTFQPQNGIGTVDLMGRLFDILDPAHQGFTFSENSPFTLDNTQIRTDVSGEKIIYSSTFEGCLDYHGPNKPVSCNHLIGQILMDLDVLPNQNINETIEFEFTVVEAHRQKLSRRGAGLSTGLPNVTENLSVDGADGFASGVLDNYRDTVIENFGAESVVQTVIDQLGVNNLLLNLSLGRTKNFVANRTVLPSQRYNNGQRSISGTLQSKESFLTQDNERATPLDNIETTISGQNLNYNIDRHLITVDNFRFSFGIENESQPLRRETRQFFGLTTVQESLIGVASPVTRYSINMSQLLLTPGVPFYLTTLGNVRKRSGNQSGLAGYGRSVEDTQMDLFITVTARPVEETFRHRSLSKNPVTDSPPSSSSLVGSPARYPSIPWPQEIVSYRPRFSFTPDDRDFFQPTYSIRLPQDVIPIASLNENLELEISSLNGLFAPITTKLRAARLATALGYEFQLPVNKFFAKDAIEFQVKIRPNPSSHPDFRKANPEKMYTIRHELVADRIFEGPLEQPLFHIH